MLFVELQNLIKEKSRSKSFDQASRELQEKIFSLKKSDFLPLIVQIGAIPENIPHDSTEEKLYTKVSDIVLAKCFIELGLKANVLHERANCADVVAESKYHNYSLIGDAKAFRLSRTAKNQKDFKVESMIHWKEDKEYAVLCCPYFQYPKKSSQIYGSALNGNVSLFSWEYFSILIENEMKETEKISLAEIWNQSMIIAQRTSVAERNACFLAQQNSAIRKLLKISDDDFNQFFQRFRKNMICRGNAEIKYWKTKINEIKSYSKEQAIQELLVALKLNEKIKSIDNYIKNLENSEC